MYGSSRVATSSALSFSDRLATASSRCCSLEAQAPGRHAARARIPFQSPPQLSEQSISCLLTRAPSRWQGVGDLHLLGVLSGHDGDRAERVRIGRAAPVLAAKASDADIMAMLRNVPSSTSRASPVAARVVGSAALPTRNCFSTHSVVSSSASRISCASVTGDLA